MVQVTPTLIRLNRFRARHIAACANERFDVAFDRSMSATRILVTCRRCHTTASGSIKDADMPEVFDFLRPPALAPTVSSLAPDPSH